MSADVEAQGQESGTDRRHMKERQGVVVSAKTLQTVIVVVTRRVRHPKYKKFMTVKKRYMAHDLVGCQEGDNVRIQETRPMSKRKRWRVLERMQSA